jgi:hypothetical protein
MDPNKAAGNLQVIRELMERPVRDSTQSGASGVIAGCVALAGLAADWCFFELFGPGHLAFWINMGVWAGVFLISLGAALGLTRMRAHRQGLPYWTPARRKILISIIAPFFAAAGLTAAMLYQWYFSGDGSQWGLMFPCWMLFYGLACWQVGEYSIREIRVMGAAFVLAGILSAAFFQMHPYWSMGVTFGGFHIAYGIVVWIRHGG